MKTMARKNKTKNIRHCSLEKLFTKGKYCHNYSNIIINKVTITFTVVQGFFFSSF
jgi:hypothetical protein